MSPSRGCPFLPPLSSSSSVSHYSFRDGMGPGWKCTLTQDHLCHPTLPFYVSTHFSMPTTTIIPSLGSLGRYRKTQSELRNGFRQIRCPFSVTDSSRFEDSKFLFTMTHFYVFIRTLVSTLSPRCGVDKNCLKVSSQVHSVHGTPSVNSLRPRSLPHLLVHPSLLPSLVSC